MTPLYMKKSYLLLAVIALGTIGGIAFLKDTSGRSSEEATISEQRQ
jgi:hypothetical protein